jgi:hypothetical protein
MQLKCIIKINLTCVLFLFNVATKTHKIPCVTYIVYLLGWAWLDLSFLNLFAKEELFREQNQVKAQGWRVD